MDYEKKIDIPFGAHDSELKGWEYTIPEGMEAIIKDGKVIVREKESEGDRIRKYLIEELKAAKSVGELKFVIPQPTREECISYLEKMKEANKAIEAVGRIDKYIDEHVANAHDMKDSNPDKKYYRGWYDALGKMAGILQDVYSDEKQKEQKPVDFPTTDEEVNEFLETHPKVEVPEKYKTPDFVFSKQEYESHPIISKDTTSVRPAEWSEEDERMLEVISYKISQHQGNDERSLFTPDEAEFIGGMEALNTVLEHEAERVGSSKELEKANALYEQLKRL